MSDNIKVSANNDRLKSFWSSMTWIIRNNCNEETHGKMNTIKTCVLSQLN